MKNSVLMVAAVATLAMQMWSPIEAEATLEEETTARLEKLLEKLRSEDDDVHLVAVEAGLNDPSAVVRGRTVDEAVARGTAIGTSLVLRHLLDGRSNFTIMLELPDYTKTKIEERKRLPPFVTCGKTTVSAEGDIQTPCLNAYATGRLLRGGMNLQLAYCVLDCALMPTEELPVSMSCTYTCKQHPPVAAKVKLE